MFRGPGGGFLQRIFDLPTISFLLIIYWQIPINFPTSLVFSDVDSVFTDEVCERGGDTLELTTSYGYQLRLEVNSGKFYDYFTNKCFY